MRWILATLALGLLSAAAAGAQERDYCPARPGLGTPACTIAPGRISVETGVADWRRDETPDERSDTLLIGDTLLRVGISDRVEAQIGWTPFGHVRSRDKTTGAIDTTNRVSDVLIGFKANLGHPDGSGFAIAVQPFAIVPVGRAPVSAGDWSAGIVAPMSFDLTDMLNLQFSPELDAATDEDGRGRHLAYSGTWGLEMSITDAVSATLEFQAARDQDPSGRNTQLVGAVSATWMPSDDLQLDVGTNLGLNRATPDVEVYFGFSRRL